MLLHIFHLQDFCTLPHVFAHLSITRASQAQKLLDLGSIWVFGYNSAAEPGLSIILSWP